MEEMKARGKREREVEEEKKPEERTTRRREGGKEEYVENEINREE